MATFAFLPSRLRALITCALLLAPTLATAVGTEMPLVLDCGDEKNKKCFECNGGGLACNDLATQLSKGIDTALAFGDPVEHTAFLTGVQNIGYPTCNVIP